MLPKREEAMKNELEQCPSCGKKTFITEAEYKKTNSPSWLAHFSWHTTDLAGKRHHTQKFCLSCGEVIRVEEDVYVT